MTVDTFQAVNFSARDERALMLAAHDQTPHQQRQPINTPERRPCPNSAAPGCYVPRAMVFLLQLSRLGLFLVLVHSLIAVCIGIGMAIGGSFAYAAILVLPGLLIAWLSSRGVRATTRSIRRRV
jgi:hypothetical protein